MFQRQTAFLTLAAALVMLTGAAAPHEEATQADGRFAAILYADSADAGMHGISEDVKNLGYLLTDTMFGGFSLLEAEKWRDLPPDEIPSRLTSAGVDSAAASTSFYYVFGPEPAAADDVAETDPVPLLPGKPKIVVRDLTILRAPDDAGTDDREADSGETAQLAPELSVGVSGEGAVATLEFVFTGGVTADSAPVRTVVNALRGRADENRDRSVTVAELAAFFQRHSTGEKPPALGDLADEEVFRLLTLAEFAEQYGADRVISQADEYLRRDWWIEALLLCRQVKDEKYGDSRFRAITEQAEQALSIQAHYMANAREENLARTRDEGLALIDQMLQLTQRSYVTEADNRRLFARGVGNVQLLLRNPKLRKGLLKSENEGAVAQLVNFISETAGHVSEKGQLSRADFKSRVKRIIMENETTAKLPESVIITEFIYGIPAALDPNSAFISRQDYKEFQDDTAGHFGGLGIEITLEEITFDQKALTVVTALDGTPASEAGLLPGDRIIAIEGEPTDGWSLTQAVRQLRGPVNTKVTITVVHRSSPDSVDITITRGRIRLESVKGYKIDLETGKWIFALDGDGRIGYIRLTDFKDDTPQGLKRALAALVEGGMHGLVLDLRFNHGGLLTSGVKVTDAFISEGVIVSVKGANTVERAQKAHYFTTYEDFPLVVLVNDQTASAAEILAGALKDHDRATLVGTRSFGKGTVQTVYELRRGSAAFKLTTAKYYTPSGVCIHREPYSNEGGLTPDVEVALTPDENSQLVEVWHLRSLREEARERLLQRQRKLADSGADLVVSDPETFRDRQLEKAVEVLRSKMGDTVEKEVLVGQGIWPQTETRRHD